MFAPRTYQPHYMEIMENKSSYRLLVDIYSINKLKDTMKKYILHKKYYPDRWLSTSIAFRKGSVKVTLSLIIIIIIITLFQEDNIFGRVASLTYGPQLTNV